eukprot:7115154-Alexandrium_andersonii.AAC.1
MWDFLETQHAENSNHIREDLRQLLRELHLGCEDLPDLQWHIEQTLQGQDPARIQLWKRMERLWWHFSDAWKEIRGRGRVLSFGRSRTLTDFPKVAAYLSAPQKDAIDRFLEQEARQVAEEYEAAMRLAYQACGRYRSPSPERLGRHASPSGVRGGAASDEEAEVAAAYHAELERPLEDDAAQPTS